MRFSESWSDILQDWSCLLLSVGPALLVFFALLFAGLLAPGTICKPIRNNSCSDGEDGKEYLFGLGKPAASESADDEKTSEEEHKPTSDVGNCDPDPAASLGQGIYSPVISLVLVGGFLGLGASS